MVSISDPGQSRPRALLGGTVLFLVLPWPFVAMRLWARHLKQVRLCFNDYMIIIAAVLASAVNITWILLIVIGGLGQNEWELSDTDQIEYSKLGFVGTVLWPLANAAVKLSILDFYRQIFTRRWIRYSSYVVAVLTILWCIGCFVAAFTVCTPPSVQWDPSVDGHCGNTYAYWLADGIINLVLDFTILILPQPIIWCLQIELRKKLSLAFVFGLGVGICIVSILRCWSFTVLDNSNAQQSGVLLGICSCLEPTLGVVNACLPLLPPAFARIKSSSLTRRLLRLVPGRRRTHEKIIEIQKLGIPFGTPGNSPTRPRYRRWPYFMRGGSDQIFVTNDIDVSANEDRSNTSGLSMSSNIFVPSQGG